MSIFTILLFLFALMVLYYFFFTTDRKINKTRQVEQLYKNKITGIISRGDGRLIYKNKSMRNPYRLTYFSCPNDNNLHNLSKLGENKCMDGSNEVTVDNDLWTFFYDNDDMSKCKFMSNEIIDGQQRFVLKPSGYQQCLDAIEKKNIKKPKTRINTSHECASFGGSTSIPYIELDDKNNKVFNWALELSENGNDYYIKSIEGKSAGYYLVIGDKSRLYENKLKTDRDFPMLVHKDDIPNLNCKMLKFIPQQ